ncbi:MAG: cytochrome c-type biogenesis protein CcmH [Myxococcales bacterium]
MTRILPLVAATLLAASPALAQDLAAPSNDRNFVAQAVGEPKGAPLTGAALEQRTHEVGLLIRCPVCQGSSIADSPSDTAQNMKREVRDLLSQGFDEDQVLRYFELAYGEFVRLQPKAEGVNVLVWIGPGVLLLLGLGLVANTLRQHKRAADDAGPVPGRDTLPDDPRLAAYVKKARELAYGWPGGAPPSEGR